MSNLASMNRRTTRLRAAFAYVTQSGLDSLEAAIPRCVADSVVKEWLSSFDFGLTEPDALRRIIAADNSIVRIVGGRAAVVGSRLRPSVRFHPKVLWVTRARVHDFFIGSANITGAALTRNWEAGVTLSEMTMARNGSVLRQIEEWWSEAWGEADPCTESLVSQYERIRDRFLEASPVTVVLDQGDENVDLRRAKFLWAEVGPTMGGWGANSQMQLPMVCSQFFSGRQRVFVEGNRSLVSMLLNSQVYDRRSIRGQPNGMIRVNLPPVVGRLPQLESHFIVFERHGSGRFRIDLIPPERVEERVKPLRDKSNELGQIYNMGVGGRQFGWL